MSNKIQQYKSSDEYEIKSLIQKIQDFNIDENIKKMSLIKVHFVLSHIVHLSSIVRNRAKELSEDTYKKAYNLIDSSAFFFYNKIKDELFERWVSAKTNERAKIDLDNYIIDKVADQLMLQKTRYKFDEVENRFRVDIDKMIGNLKAARDLRECAESMDYEQNKPKTRKNK